MANKHRTVSFRKTKWKRPASDQFKQEKGGKKERRQKKDIYEISEISWDYN